MKTRNRLLRPDTFELGAFYLWIEPSVNCKETVVHPVWFVCYDPCPAFVIVRASDGRRQRCPRAEISTPAGIIPNDFSGYKEV